MISLVVATWNAHKVAEIQNILGPGFACLPLTAFPAAPRLVEDGETFAANATRKAVQLATWLKTQGLGTQEGRGGAEAQPTRLVLADDSGLEVDSLSGAPGVHSARFAADELGAGTNASDTANNAKLLRLLKEVPWEKRTARFHCVLALVDVNPQSAIRNCLMAPAKAGSGSRREDEEGSATIRSSCRTGSTFRLPNWGRTSRTG